MLLLVLFFLLLLLLDYYYFHFLLIHFDFDYQNLRGYFKPDTIIEYKGDLLNLEYNPVKDSNNPFPKIHKKNNGQYVIPKIMYVPTERNFLTVIKNATNVVNDNCVSTSHNSKDKPLGRTA